MNRPLENFDDVKVGDKVIYRTYQYGEHTEHIEEVVNVTPKYFGTHNAKFRKPNGRMCNSYRFCCHATEDDISRHREIEERGRMIDSIYDFCRNKTSLDALSTESLEKIEAVIRGHSLRV